MHRHLMIIAIAALLLGACGGAPASIPSPAAPPPATPPSLPAPPTATLPLPSAIPTSAPSPTLAPTAAPVDTPTSAILPGALLLTDLRGRIIQIAPDGSAAPLVEAGINGALEYDQSRAGLVYTVTDERSARLEWLREGGSVPEVLLDLPGRQIGAPRWSPDASQVALAIEGPGEPPAGLYLLSPASGDFDYVEPEGLIPELVLRPIAFSPDGARLLVGTSIPDADICGQMVIDLRARQAVELAPPAGTLTDCTRATWSPDGAQIWLTLQDAGAYAATLPGLFQADPASGEIALLLPEQREGRFLRYASPHALPDGALGVLATSSPSAAPPEPDAALWRYMMVSARPDGTLAELRRDAAIVVDAAWAPDASGVMVAALVSDALGATTELIWWPIDGGPAVIVASIDGAYALQWAR
jgi:hypothetical protein